MFLLWRCFKATRIWVTRNLVILSERRPCSEDRIISSMSPGEDMVTAAKVTPTKMAWWPGVHSVTINLRAACTTDPPPGDDVRGLIPIMICQAEKSGGGAVQRRSQGGGRVVARQDSHPQLFAFQSELGSLVGARDCMQRAAPHSGSVHEERTLYTMKPFTCTT